MGAVEPLRWGERSPDLFKSERRAFVTPASGLTPEHFSLLDARRSGADARSEFIQYLMAAI